MAQLLGGTRPGTLSLQTAKAAHRRLSGGSPRLRVMLLLLLLILLLLLLLLLMLWLLFL